MSSEKKKLFNCLDQILNHNSKHLELGFIDLTKEIEYTVLKVLKETQNLEILLIDACYFSSGFFSKLMDILSLNSAKSMTRIVLKSMEKVFLKSTIKKTLNKYFFSFENLKDLSLENNGLVALPKL